MCSGVYSYTVELPKPLNVNGTTNLVIETVQTHATYPWPQQASQKDDQALKYETDLFILSPYKTATQRAKVRYVSVPLGLTMSDMFSAALQHPVLSHSRLPRVLTNSPLTVLRQSLEQRLPTDRSHISRNPQISSSSSPTRNV